MLPYQNLRPPMSQLSSLMALRQSKSLGGHVDSDINPNSNGHSLPAGHDGNIDDNSFAKPEDKITALLNSLAQYGIQAQKIDEHSYPPAAFMHDRSAIIPGLLVLPQSEWAVSQTLRSFDKLDLHGHVPISIKSGGHGYHNGASCSGVMVNLERMTQHRVVGNTLFIGPGCLLGQLIPHLSKHRKAVPHGDCFGVGSGGHFITAGWDVILARRHGLGCQSVIGGRIALWGGSVLDVDENNHPDLLHAMRGGAAAGVGVVTEIRLRLIDEPQRATWCFTRIDEIQLRVCEAHGAFAKAANLPTDISVSFHLYFQPDQLEPICSFNIVSLLTADETIRCLEQHLGPEVTSLVTARSTWNEKTLVELRMLPASEVVKENPDMLAEISPTALQENPLLYLQRNSSLRGAGRSFFTSISHWVVPSCESMLRELRQAFRSVQSKPARERLFALVIQGGGRVSELQQACSIPLGQTLVRFEMHWDHPDDSYWCRNFTSDISEIIHSRIDSSLERHEQGEDARLKDIAKRYGGFLLNQGNTVQL